MCWCVQNEQMLTEGELSMVEDSDRVRELQDRIGDLKAEVFWELANVCLVISRMSHDGFK